MKRAKENGLRWLKQAEHNLKVTGKHLENGYFSDACFMAEQTAQVALKAFLYFNGERFIATHSVTELFKRSIKYSRNFTVLLDRGKKLDQYYIPTRYPDALGGDVIPAEVYREEQAQEAADIAKQVLNLVRVKIKE